METTEATTLKQPVVTTTAQQTPPVVTATVQQTPPVVVTPVNTITYPPTPVQMLCPACKATILTRVSHKSGLLTWLVAGGLCFLGCWLGCQFIPFCIDDCLDVDHHCPNCDAFIGTYKRLVI